MKIQRSKITIVIVIFKIMEKYKRSYCYPTRKTIQEFLSKYHDIKISLSAIDKHIKSLNEMNYIKSFRRYGQRENGTFFNKPSNRQLTRKGLSFLLSLGIYVSAWLRNFLFPKDKKYIRFSRKKLFSSPDPEHEKWRPRFSGFLSIGDILKSHPV